MVFPVQNPILRGWKIAFSAIVSRDNTRRPLRVFRANPAPDRVPVIPPVANYYLASWNKSKAELAKNPMNESDSEVYLQSDYL
uniref:Uncharacterized protein n=1 Tax=Romanomermis culicivorax TaxID=13658 RepID=A0A915IVD1_ROMCU